MESINTTLHWKDVTLCRAMLPSGHVMRGERVQLIMPEAAQRELLNKLFLCLLSHRYTASTHLWITHGDKTLTAGSADFCQHIACMLRQRGLLANLTLKENLLLPALYSDRKEPLQQAEKALPYVADFLGLGDKLNEKAGERSPYMHALISLGHCLLKKPSIVVAQQIHVGMTEEHAEKFQRKMVRALTIWNPAVLYLSSSLWEPEQLPFHRTSTLHGNADVDMEWQ